MQLINPIDKDTCKPYIGQRVCAILHDGTQVFGVISGVTENGVEFNGAVQSAEVLSKDPQKAKKQLEKIHQKNKSKLQTKAQTSAYGPVGPYGGPGGYGYGRAFALEWAAIALLFLLPFFFI
ncbi:hypothetical protein [Paenibacillus caui]|uniref:hypothetical protein n=1 Tax=Paenibacillus caui TaxID=2873927 RepID=UPI001CAA068C|nr:hypothetical protein [Paenibacillus caui]